MPVACECVRWLREVQGVNVRGDAVTLRPNEPIQDVVEGDVLLTQYGNVSHASVVVDVHRAATVFLDEENFYTKVVSVTVKESNYITCTPSTRIIVANDKHIKGVLRPA